MHCKDMIVFKHVVNSHYLSLSRCNLHHSHTCSFAVAMAVAAAVDNSHTCTNIRNPFNHDLNRLSLSLSLFLLACINSTQTL
eukprot:m.116431 g.116431  ORF g.116431 m.116431 type:complete len:82 (-) comp13609_c3_seq6:582-827(-)